MASTFRLANRRILVTRTPGRSSGLAARLQDEGAVVTAIPAIEIVPPESYAALDEVLARLDAFDWVVFTSAHAVDVFAERRNPQIPAKRIAVIGPATARVVEQHGLPVSLVAPRAVAESLAEALSPQVAGASVLLVRAAEAREVLPAALLQSGARLTIAEAYRNRIPEESIPHLRALFGARESAPEVITFTSASTVRNLVTLLDAAGLEIPTECVLASIGPITSQALREQGLEPTVEAGEASMDALSEAIAGYFAQ